MPSINGAVMTAISETKEVKGFVLAGTSIVAKQVLQEVDNSQGGSWNPKTQAKRYALANKILNIDLSDDNSDADNILCQIAKDVMNTISQDYFLFNVDANQLATDITTNNMWNGFAKVTGMDLI